MFGNELSEEKRNSSLTEALFVLGVGYVSIKGVYGISKDATNFVAGGKELGKGLNEQVSKAFDGLSIGNGPHLATAGASSVRKDMFGFVDQVEKKSVTSQKAESVEGVSVGIKGTGGARKETTEPIVAEEVILERTKGLDLMKHPIQQKQLSAKKMKELRVKIENRTITKVEYEQYTWNKKFAKHRSMGVNDFS
ncbi:hypothetical protein BME96_03670 [Virgibacillus halodenitrificans]|uniref:Uncharacterized protein n=1 Tax=Virgibacillus halodenitrificans TaxID=1482 RepID=A0AAC9NK09_VIRHA|nr:hypothetical protein BME96_03670 [Virgibacillus halodenitrificans]